VVEVVLRNTGLERWDGPSRAWLAPTEPRDRTSLLRHPSWQETARAAPFEAVDGQPDVYAATFSIRAPEVAGRYSESFGVVTDDGRWFSDDGGPADGAIRFDVEVTAQEEADRSLDPAWEPFRGDGGCACQTAAPWEPVWWAAFLLARVRPRRRSLRK
jgi:hypothetical protein